ncbi:MAG TPA: substrate-binding domain-containing protein [Casimicrobiaceae bacterium]|nr:substrate-binding domain-containing protein [Casimicrobiaceae bacterium]
MQLHLISAGAAKGLVEALRERFAAESRATIDATFGAVGAMKELLLAGARCDAIILTQALLDKLADDGYVQADSIMPLGHVHTGIALRERDVDVAIETADALREALVAATSVYIPDPHKATAAIHFLDVLARLGIRKLLDLKLRPYPNGAAAMAALAEAGDAHPIGCTQVTEIKYTPGVKLVDKLPIGFELATLYSAAACRNANDASLAKRFVAMVAGPESAALRRDGGFE